MFETKLKIYLSCVTMFIDFSKELSTWNGDCYEKHSKSEGQGAKQS